MDNKKNLCIPYFILTSLFIGAGNLFLIMLFANITVKAFALPVIAAVYFFVCFAAGRVMTAYDIPKKPESAFFVYFPVLFRVFAAVVMNSPVIDKVLDSYETTPAVMLAVLIMLLFSEQLAFLEFSGTLFCCAGNIAGVLGFALGERLFAKEKRPLPVRSVSVFLLISAAAFGGGEYYKYIDELSTVTPYYDPAAEMIYDNPVSETVRGYGFPYENGWSSVDLRPYYVENKTNILARLEGPAEFTVSDPLKMPVLDGAEAAYPVYSAFALACYEDIAHIQYAAKERDAPEDAVKPIRFTNTIEAFKSLVNGEVDIFFGAAPSQAQRELAESAGKELVLTPIGKEAFVFIVSEDNPVDGLSSEQIRDIYSGKVTSWRKLGGKNIPILAFQRPENSGSQTMMQYFMGDVPLKEPLMNEYEQSMLGIISSVAEYQNKESSIGYSFRYYASLMTGKENGGSGKIKFLSLDGVYPDEESIRNGTYPMTTSLYAVTLADNPNENTREFLKFMTGSGGQEIVGKTGYVCDK